jgi:GT2 family glycosyltransferase
MSTKLGCIAMVTRNNLHLTKLAVASARAQEHRCRIMVLDNASTDGTAQWLRTISELVLVADQTQRSLSACWNSLLTAAFLAHDHVLVINNDVELRPDCFHSLLEWSTDYNAPFVTGVSVRSKLELRPRETPRSSAPHPDFSCFMIRKDCYKKVGPFNEDLFPAWFEDNDYHVRMHRAGIKAVSIDLPFVHHSASTMKTANPTDKSMYQRGYAKNKQWFKDTYGCYPDESDQYSSLFQ